MKRRAFSKNLLLGTSAFFVPNSNFFSPGKALNILILGGTNFVGPAIVQWARRRGHNIYLFNRGITNPNLFPDLPHFFGDRTKGEDGYQQLSNKFWDVVIDTWPEKSNLVRDALRQLKASTRHYLFVSSISVYKDLSLEGLDEHAETVDINSPDSDWQYPEHKKASEEIVKEYFPRNHTIFRCGPIKGWRDPNNDLAYWLVKIRRGERILGPGDGKDPVQFVDVADVARFIIHTAEVGAMGTFNVTNPAQGLLNWNQLLEKAQSKLNRDSKIIWNSTEFLHKNDIEPLSAMPLWVPSGVDAGLMQISAKKAYHYGLEQRPLNRTFTDVLKWFDLNFPPDFQFGRGGEESPGLSPRIEESLIETIS